MYHLVKSLYLHATSKEEYSVLVLGLDNAGKTTLLEQIKRLAAAGPDAAPDTTIATVPTVGQNVALIDLPDMYLKIWDVGGQHTLRRLWQSYYDSCHAIVFVIDSTDMGDGRLSAAATAATAAGGDERSSNSSSIPAPVLAHPSVTPAGRLDECRDVLESILHNSSTSGVPILVLANKQDREDCVEVVRIKEGFVRRVFEGEKGQNVRDSRVLPLSALTGTGVQEAIEWIRSRVKWNKEARPPVMR